VGVGERCALSLCSPWENLYSTGMANGPTKSVQTVDWRLFDQTVSRVREAFADLPPDELNSLIDEAVANVRRENGP